MKEHTYGWYPSAKNVYEERRMGALTPYQIEALYRYRDSKYYQPPVTPPEQRTPKTSRQHLPARRSESTVSHCSSRTPTQRPDHVDLQVRASSAPIHTTYKPPPKLIIPTPQQCWSTHVPETAITVIPPQSSAGRVSASFPKWTTPYASQRATPVPTAVVDSSVSPQKQEIYEKIVRIKSATVRREASPVPPRPSKSAGLFRPSPTLVTPECAHMQTPTHDYDVTARVQMSDRPPSATYSPARPIAPSPPSSSKRDGSRSHIPSPSTKPPSGRKTPLRPKAPSPYTMELHIDAEDYDNRQGTPDYDEMGKKYGWMMEVHGDPLKIKKVSKRLPYTVQVDEPETERDPPKVHMENLETFFLNTIPRRPMTFAIDKEWISEVIHEKRMETQKKQGINYRYKNFSFVY